MEQQESEQQEEQQPVPVMPELKKVRRTILAVLKEGRRPPQLIQVREDAGESKQAV